MDTLLERCGRVSGPVVTLTLAAVANATAVFTVSNYVQQLGTKAFIPRKLRVRNIAAGNQWLIVGTGAGATFVAAYPGFMILNNLDNVWQEFELPRVQFVLTMTAYPAALVAAGTMEVQVEVEENG